MRYKTIRSPSVSCAVGVIHSHKRLVIQTDDEAAIKSCFNALAGDSKN